MGTNVAPVYACLTVAYLEEHKLFPKTLPQFFNAEQCSWIEEYYKRYMDDGFLPLLNSINLELFMKCLNSLHPLINFTYEVAKFTKNDTNIIQTLNFLDVIVILDNHNSINTDVFYKATNSHEYLNYHSDHPNHTKNNVPYNLAKRIICFVSSPQQTENRLEELKSFLIKRDYPINIINKAFFNARLQGPAPLKEKQKILPLVTTNYSNYNCKNIIRETSRLLDNTSNNDLKEIFSDTKVILSQRQPKNILSILSNAKYEQNRETSVATINKCTDPRCKICSSYLQFTTEFQLSNGKTWHTKSTLSCNSKNVIYYLTCNQCQANTTYIGKTNNIRLRTNQHISSCRTGNGTDKFDAHVYNCQGTPPKEPYFKLFLMMKLQSDSALLTYEKHFHSKNYDTLNTPYRL